MLALALPLLAGGCAQVGLAPAVSSEPTLVAGRTITVEPGESIYTIAKRYNVQSRDLISLNRLKPPYRLEAGQSLHLPGGRTYTVRPGDSLSEIAQRFRLDTTQLARANQITGPSYLIRVGQVLTLPGGGEAPLPPAPARKPEAADANPVHGVAPGAIQTVPLAPPPAAAPAPPAAQARPAPARAAVPPKASPQAARELAVIPPAHRRETAAPGAATPVRAAPAESADSPAKVVEVPAPPAGGGRFLWPVKGTVISEYGGKPDGSQNDGVNIGAARGTAVIAADNGVVAYVGNELRSYGNLLLIRHASGLVTAYAHLDSTLVQRGAKVRRGQKIGTVGSSGKVSVPQIHFEVRRGSQAVDPGDYLEGRT